MDIMTLFNEKINRNIFIASNFILNLKKIYFHLTQE